MSVVSLPAVRCHKVYDPRLRDLVFRTGDVSFAKDCGVPRSTCNDWKNGKFNDVVTLDVFGRERADLEAEVLKLRRKLRILGALLRIFIALVRVFGLKLSDKRLPEGKHKHLLAVVNHLPSGKQRTIWSGFRPWLLRAGRRPRCSSLP
jgi:hypothetical protein